MPHPLAYSHWIPANKNPPMNMATAHRKRDMQTVQADPIQAHDEIRAAVDSHLSRFITRRELPANLDEAVRYALLGPGKRTRPILAVLTAEALGGKAEAAIPGACSVELIHAFSLVHDDLPALDNDELRRGRATTHIRFGEALALLAGDAMMSLAFEILRDAPDPARSVRELATACTDMIAGQVLDTLGPQHSAASSQTDPLEHLRQIHRSKTGALIRASCRLGAISAAAEDDSEAMQSITAFAEAIGLMFQAVDDLLDVEQSAEHVGKATGKDREAGKLTFPSVIGVEQTRVEIRLLRERAMEALSTLGDKANPLRLMCENLARRTK